MNLSVQNNRLDAAETLSISRSRKSRGTTATLNLLARTVSPMIYAGITVDYPSVFLHFTPRRFYTCSRRALQTHCRLQHPHFTLYKREFVSPSTSFPIRLLNLCAYSFKVFAQIYIGAHSGVNIRTTWIVVRSRFLTRMHHSLTCTCFLVPVLNVCSVRFLYRGPKKKRKHYSLIKFRVRAQFEGRERCIGIYCKTVCMSHVICIHITLCDRKEQQSSRSIFPTA